MFTILVEYNDTGVHTGWIYGHPLRRAYWLYVVVVYCCNLDCYCFKWNVGIIFVRLYIGCDTCSRWFHGSCVGVSASDIQLMTAYICPECINRSTLSSQQPAASNTRAATNKCWVALSHLLKHLEVC